MNKLEFATAMKHLSIAFNKEFTQDDLNVYYEYLKDYEFKVFKNVIKEIVKCEKFLPKISEIISYCDRYKNDELINQLDQRNYFKNANDKEKIIMWMNEGIIPEWFREELKNLLPNKTECNLQIE